MSESSVADMTRDVLERFGVIKPAKLPALDKLCKSIRSHKGTVELTIGSGVATASVRLSGNAFDGTGDTPDIAVADAFAQALLAEPGQMSFLGGDGTLTDDERARMEGLRRRTETDNPATEDDDDEA